MAVVAGVLAHLLAWTVDRVTAIFDGYDTEGITREDVPGKGYEEQHIAGALDALASRAGLKVETAGFVTEIHKLYYDPNRQANPYQKQHVHFHNWDHGCNVWSLAHWYGTSADNELSAEQTFLLEVAALSHDVMHPGTQNSEKVVSETFLPLVNTWKRNAQISPPQAKDWTLATYAENLLNKTGLDKEAVKTCKLVHCQDANDLVAGLKALAPQEVLHSWITMNVLRRNMPAIFADVKRLQLVVKAILMTSITAHFSVMKTPEKLANHFGDGDIPREGLLLHLFDMGYLCETGMRNPTDNSADTGIIFAARYLLESGNPPQGLDVWDNVVQSQMGFSQYVVLPYLKYFSKGFGRFPIKTFEGGIEKFQANVQAPSQSKSLREVAQQEANEMMTRVADATTAQKILAWATD